MGDVEQLKKLRDAAAQIKNLGDQAVQAQEEQNRRYRQLVDAQIRAGEEQTRIMLNDLDDPLNYHFKKELDIEFLSGGKIDPKTMRRVVLQWRDIDGNEVYTRESYVERLAEIRALRDKIVAQQKVWGGLRLMNNLKYKLNGKFPKENHQADFHSKIFLSHEH